jgi:hypothetical protein
LKNMFARRLPLRLLREQIPSGFQQTTAPDDQKLQSLLNKDVVERSKYFPVLGLSFLSIKLGSGNQWKIKSGVFVVAS